jgi:hypothetical protein
MDTKELIAEVQATMPENWVFQMFYKPEEARWLLMASNHAWAIENGQMDKALFCSEAVSNATGKLDIDADHIREKAKWMLNELKKKFPSHLGTSSNTEPSPGSPNP